MSNIVRRISQDEYDRKLIEYHNKIKPYLDAYIKLRLGKVPKYEFDMISRDFKIILDESPLEIELKDIISNFTKILHNTDPVVISFQCKVCGREFYSESNLYDHYDNVHNKGNKE